MILSLVLRSFFKLLFWCALLAIGWWWVVNIGMHYEEGPPTWEPSPQSIRVVQKDGTVVLLPPVSVTAPAER